MPAEARQIERPAPDELAQAVLDAHHGDPIAALRDVIADASFLYDELETASRLLSRGAGRGWKPRFRRGE